MVTAWDGKVVNESSRVEAAVGDGEAPNEVQDVGDFSNPTFILIKVALACLEQREYRIAWF